MNQKIPSPHQNLSGQNNNELLRRAERAERLDKTDTTGKKKLDASYELKLSETAQAMIDSKLPAVRNQEDARKQLEQLRAAAERSPSTVLGSQKPNAKTVLDLLA